MTSRFMSNNKMLALFAKVVNRFLGRKLHVIIKEDLSYAKDNLFTYNLTPFMRDTAFMKAYHLGKATDKDRFLKGVDLEWRLHTLCWAAQQALKLAGDFVEFGVRTAFFSTTIMDYLQFEKEERNFVMIDSFRGVIPDVLTDSEYKREQPGVKSNALWGQVYEDVLNQFSSRPNVRVVKGIVPEILPALNLDKIAFVSMDLNSAIPEKAALEFLWDKIVPGGLIILDDYGYPGFEAQQKIHDEFAKSKGTSVLCLPTCQGMIIKPKTIQPQ